ncbi:MAG TPA: TM0106 family RecB-like putative nuclease [Nitrospiria bacterium]
MSDTIFLSASDVALVYSDPFGLWQDHHGDPRLKDPPDEFSRFLMEQGLRIERELLQKRHERFQDLKDLSFESARTQTAQLLKYGHVVIYGGAVDSGAMGLRARPDVIRVERGRCFIEEYKLAGTPDETHEIQALVYAYILRRAYKMESEVCIVSRRNEVFEIPYDERRVQEAIRQALGILAASRPPPPVYNCRSRWRRLQNRTAHETRDVTLTWNVGAVQAQKLRAMNILTVEDLSRADARTLSGLSGLGPKKVGQILNSAKALATRTVIRIGKYTPLENPPELEIYLDLEGSGELFQEDPAWNCLYLIGLIPRAGQKEGGYRSFLARRPEDEKAMLTDFLDDLGREKRPYRLYHWDHYERTQLRKAAERHGLAEGYAALIEPHLEDLCKAAQAACILPTPGYSIKVVAPYFGFAWSQDATEVDAMISAMIWYKQAIEGGTGQSLEKVLRYNEDDCRAMIVVKDGFEKIFRDDGSAAPSGSSKIAKEG